MAKRDDGSLQWALKEAERAVRDAEVALRNAAHRLNPGGGIVTGSMAIHFGGVLVGFAWMCQRAAVELFRIRQWSKKHPQHRRTT